MILSGLYLWWTHRIPLATLRDIATVDMAVAGVLLNAHLITPF